MNDPAEGRAPQPIAGWEQTLDALERNLLQAVQSIALLRVTLAGSVPGPSLITPQPAPAPAPAAVMQAVSVAAEVAAVEPAEFEERTRSTFERLWERIELERRERDEVVVDENGGRRGLELLPQQYLMTVEDREGKVDLIPLHRALLGVAPMEDVGLLSFANGVPVVSLRLVGELDLARLGHAVSDAMDRDCEVIPQENSRLYLRLKARDSKEA